MIGRAAGLGALVGLVLAITVGIAVGFAARPDRADLSAAASELVPAGFESEESDVDASVALGRRDAVLVRATRAGDVDGFDVARLLAGHGYTVSEQEVRANGTAAVGTRDGIEVNATAFGDAVGTEPVLTLDLDVHRPSGMAWAHAPLLAGAGLLGAGVGLAVGASIARRRPLSR